MDFVMCTFPELTWAVLPFGWPDPEPRHHMSSHAIMKLQLQILSHSVLAPVAPVSCLPPLLGTLPVVNLSVSI